MMKKIFILFLAAFICLWTCRQAAAAPELYEIQENEHTSTIYERAVQFFTEKFPETFIIRLANSYKYIDMINAIFDEKGVPLEIAYLPFIESGFRPLSIGPRGAVGLWQFVRGTGRSYGLRIDKYVDERKDPVKSTIAAAHYLLDLHSMFGAWDIALAAYNAGPGRIKKIPDIYTSKKTPKVTRKYVPSLMAAYTMAQNPEDFGFYPDERTSYEENEYIEIMTEKSESLKAIAIKHNTTVKELKELNPALRTDKTPPYPYTIRVPAI